VAVRPKAKVSGRLITGTAGSNPADGMDIVCCVLCMKRSVRLADHSYRGVLMDSVCVCLCVWCVVCGVCVVCVCVSE